MQLELEYRTSHLAQRLVARGCGLTTAGASAYLDDSDKILSQILSVSPALEYHLEHSRHSVFNE